MRINLSGSTSFRNNSKFGNWCLPHRKEKLIKLFLKDIDNLILESNLKNIFFKDIAYKGFDLPRHQTHENCICCQGKRYNKVMSYENEYPGILLKGKKHNVFNKEYRMLDGKHRIMKLKEKGNIKSNFYVVSYDEIEEHLKIIK